MAKTFLLSKTFWFNTFGLVGTYFGVKEIADPALQEEIMMTVVGVINVYLRFKTKTPIKLV